MEKITLFLILIALTISCEKNKIDFGDIYLTDDVGNSLGGGSDESEWKTDAAFNDSANNLFDKTLSQCTEDNIVDMYPFFPNPFINNIYGNFQAQQAGSLEIIGVDEDYEVLVEKQIIEVDSGYNSIQLNLSELASGTTFRFFYKFYFDNCELQGYGDAQKQ